MGLIYLCDKCGRKVESGKGFGSVPHVILYPRNRYAENTSHQKILCDDCMRNLEEELNVLVDCHEKTE